MKGGKGYPLVIGGPALVILEGKACNPLQSLSSQGPGCLALPCVFAGCNGGGIVPCLAIITVCAATGLYAQGLILGTQKMLRTKVRPRSPSLDPRIECRPRRVSGPW